MKKFRRLIFFRQNLIQRFSKEWEFFLYRSGSAYFQVLQLSKELFWFKNNSLFINIWNIIYALIVWFFLVKNTFLITAYILLLKKGVKLMYPEGSKAFKKPNTCYKIRNVAEWFWVWYHSKNISTAFEPAF